MIELNNWGASRIILTVTTCVFILESILYAVGSLLGGQYRTIVVVAMLLIIAILPFTVGFLWKRPGTSQNFRGGIVLLLFFLIVLGIGTTIWRVTYNRSNMISMLLALAIVTLLLYFPFAIGRKVGTASY